MCEVLEINIEHMSIRNDGHNRVDHYGTDFDEKYNLGLVKGHYFIDDYTNIRAYCLEHYSEVKDIKGCNNMYKKVSEKCLKEKEKQSK